MEINQDLILGIIIAMFGLLLIFWIIPIQVNDKGSFGLPPSLAPRSLAWLMVAMGAVLTAQNLKLHSAGSRRGLRRQDIVYVIASVLAVATMLVLMKWIGAWVDRPYAGFLVAAPIGLTLFTLLHTGAPLWVYLFNAIAAPAVIYGGFWWGLSLPLP
ncbi:tripartite tricarboxylate transporter TctB family protein [Shimia thalassica]|uniref:tripartite tricarboxylate transporter TctB family protein n=1 Tax=Shimia thalassica TaxID=1715693 RepID=UPI0026E2F267|nr:tripartite tricarboxylate transporter TctB family protein [Shimia thalassica]MDO6485948.1 tripartite tricarboxylate transporter TctB family protein [Shimia thalassica]MDO6800385.1 tripartite tricarboxylate transporter TctB family protein [Shimia thalassica]